MARTRLIDAVVENPEFSTVQTTKVGVLLLAGDFVIPSAIQGTKQVAQAMYAFDAGGVDRTITLPFTPGGEKSLAITIVNMGVVGNLIVKGASGSSTLLTVPVGQMGLFKSVLFGWSVAILSAGGGGGGGPTTLTGDVTGTGTGTVPTTLATVNGNVGTFQGLTVNAKGLVTGAVNQGYAPLASPTFTGTPAGPTASPGTNTTQLATTAYVSAAFSAGVTSFNTRVGAVTLQTADVTGVGGALIASPTFTGAPAGPTAAPGTNSTQLATTAYADTGLTGKVAKTGDTMSSLLSIVSATQPSFLLQATGNVPVAIYLQKLPAATGNSFNCSFNGMSGTSLRWVMSFADATPESTGNVGSNFAVSRFTDAGGFVDIPLYITRSSGKVEFSGTNTSDNAAAGRVGEWVEASVAWASNVGLTNAAPVNATSISLTAGDWDVSGMVGFAGGATTIVNGLYISLSTVSAVFSTTPPSVVGTAAFNSVPIFNNNLQHVVRVGPARISLAVTTTVFLVVEAFFATSTCVIYGANINARRAR